MAFPVPLGVGRTEELTRATMRGDPVPPSTLPVEHPTVPFWSSKPEDNPLAREGAEDTLPDDVDICIIGSGITGVGFAYHISNLLKDQIKDNGRPLKIVILEARDFCMLLFGINIFKDSRR